MINVLSGWPVVVIAAMLATGCWSAPSTLVIRGDTNVGIWIEGLAPCRPGDGDLLRIDPNRPLTLFVHGCNFSAGGFKTLAQVFEAHGQQTICFNYNDRDRLEISSTRLMTAIEALSEIVPKEDITILGHSQGGLISRHALVHDGKRPLRVGADFHIQLVTVSSPFGGISSASHCGLTWLHVITLGLTAVVCQGITGSKWHEIYPDSRFMRRPGTLGSAVTKHIKIVTDERGACRRTRPNGHCAEDDYIFSLNEQSSAAVDGDSRVTSTAVKAGHVEIVGERGNPPTKLLEVLQAQDILARTPPERRTEMTRLLAQLY